MEQHLALYGNVRIPRAKCEKCHRWALVIDKRLQCCDSSVNHLTVREHKRISHPPNKRVRPSRKEAQRLRKIYNNCCAYCQQGFGWIVNYHTRRVRLRLTWDHHIPWDFTQDNNSSNFLPACQYCNSWKSNIMFYTLAEAKAYLITKWEHERNKE